MRVDDRILAVDEGRVEILGLPHREHPVNKGQVSEEFWPGTDRNDFSVWVSLLNHLKKGCEKNMLSPASVALGDDVLFFGHWLLVCDVSIVWCKRL